MVEFKFNDDEFAKWERQVNEALKNIPVPDGPEDEAAASVRAEIEKRGLDIDHAGALEIVRKARDQQQ